MMPDRHRESLSVLSEIRSQSPDVRLGQHLDVFGFMDEVHVNCGLATIEDDELQAVMYCHRSELLDRAHKPSLLNRRRQQVSTYLSPAAQNQPTSRQLR